MADIYLSFKDKLLIHDCLKSALNQEVLYNNDDVFRAKNVMNKMARSANKRFGGYGLKEVELYEQ